MSEQYIDNRNYIVKGLEEIPCELVLPGDEIRFRFGGYDSRMMQGVLCVNELLVLDDRPVFSVEARIASAILPLDTGNLIGTLVLHKIATGESLLPITGQSELAASVPFKKGIVPHRNSLKLARQLG